MRLQLRKFTVKDVVFTERTSLQKGILYLDKNDLLAAIKDETCFKEMDLEIVKPGDRTRIVHVLDAVQPRYKATGESAFPGLTGKIEPVGRGVTHSMDGVAVLVSCARQKGLGNIVHESIIDMTGPGAEYSIFSDLINIVVKCETKADLSDVEFSTAVRMAGLKAAEWIASTTKDLEPELTEEYETDSDAAGELPKVAYIYLVQSQGYTRQTFVYGADLNSSLPTVLHPNEVLDGAVVSGNYVIGSQKNPTYLHLNNPVILDLMQRHGKEVNFTGVIIANENSLLREKERSAVVSAKLAGILGAEGAIITKEGGGNTYTDLMLSCRECEKLGISTVLITNEVAGPDGDQPPLVDFIPEANAIVSTGNMDEIVEVGEVQKVVGGNRIDGIPGHATAAFSTGLGRLYTSTNTLGKNKLAGTEI